MLRFFGGVLSTLLLVAAGFFIWKSRAETEELIPPASKGAALVTPLKPGSTDTPPPSAPAKSREEKRFARADKNDDGKVTKAEMLEPRRKAFAKLDVNGNGTLSFEEWTVKTSEKFNSADADRNGALTSAEFETTKPKTRPKPRCSC